MVQFYTSVIFLSLSFYLSREEKKMMKMRMTITNLSGTSSKKSTQIRIVAVVKSQTSLACEAFVLRELNACVLCASYVEGCIPWTLSCAELPCVESEQCSGVPPEPWLFFFSVFQWMIWTLWLNIPVLSLQNLIRWHVNVFKVVKKIICSDQSYRRLLTL